MKHTIKENVEDSVGKGMTGDMVEEVQAESEYAARLAVDIIKEIMATVDDQSSYNFDVLMDYYFEAFENELIEQGNPFSG